MTKEEFQKQVIPLGDKMYRIAFRMLQNQESARDAIQELFLKLWEIRHKLGQLSNIEAFACSMIKNKCIDKIRMQKPTTDIEILKERTHDPCLVFETAEQSDLVKRIIGLLPERQRLIIEMRDIDNCTFEEIGQVLGITELNVRVQLSHARKLVKEGLKKVYDYGLSGN